MGIQKEAISQEDYFRGQIDYIDKTREQLIFWGYDSPFMEREETIKAIKRANMKRVAIYGVFPEGIETELDKIKNDGMVEIIKVSSKIKSLKAGYTLFDMWGFSIWDSRKLTDYVPEKTKGVYFREMRYMADFENSPRMAKNIDKFWEEKSRLLLEMIAVQG
jgi:hypothetical protein